MTIIDAIKKGLKAAGVNEKYAAKVQKLFKIEKEEDIDTYVALFKDNILPDLEDTSAVEKARKDAIAEYEKNNGLKDGKPIKPVKKTKKTAKSEEDDEDEDEDEDFEGLPASVVKLLKAQQKQISELTAKWFNRIDVNSETSVEEQIKELQEEFAEIKQSVIDDEVAGGGYKPNSYKPKERSEKEWLELMEDEEGANNGTASLGLEE